MEMHKSGTTESYLFMIGSSDFHSGKKTLKLTKKKRERARMKEDFLMKRWV